MSFGPRQWRSQTARITTGAASLLVDEGGGSSLAAEGAYRVTKSSREVASGLSVRHHRVRRLVFPLHIRPMLMSDMTLALHYSQKQGYPKLLARSDLARVATSPGRAKFPEVRNEDNGPDGNSESDLAMQADIMASLEPVDLKDDSQPHPGV